MAVIKRFQLPVIFIVMNNNGIYTGLDGDSWKSVTAAEQRLGLSIPPTSLLYGTRYDKLAGAFGAQGYHAETIPELNQALLKAFRDNVLCPVIINVVVHPNSSRKAQENSWLTKAKL